MALIAETERLLIREQTLDDLDGLAAVLCDPITMSFYPKPFSRDDAEGWIRRNIESYEGRGFGLWALVLKETGEFIGQCGLMPRAVEGKEEIEAGWHVNRAHWRRGYASEAGAESLKLATERFDLERIVSIILPENEPSAGVARKIGMNIERRVVYKGLTHDLWVSVS